MLRVIAGEYGGRVLKTVRGIGTRPLLGQVREALFNILGPDLVDAEVWDLFAGTGASGIEALSRGAAHVTFVEKANPALVVLRANLGQLGEEALERSRVVKADAWEPPVDNPGGGGPVGDPADGDPADEDPEADPEAETIAPNLIFLDPPYAQVAEDPVRCAVRAARLAECLAPGGVLCFHFPDGLLDEDDFDSDLPVDLRRWGRSAIALLGREPHERVTGPDHDEGAVEPVVINRPD